MVKIAGKFIHLTAYVLIAVIIGFLIGIIKNCSHIEGFIGDGFSKGDTIDIAILYAPGSYFQSLDSICGINHEIIKSFSTETKIPVKILPISDTANAMKMLEAGKYDILASMPLDNNIKKRFLTSESIFLDRLVLIQNKDTTTGEIAIKSSPELNGKKIYIAAGSTAAQRLLNLSNEIGGSIQIMEEENLSDELLTLKVATGDIPLAVVNERIAKKIASNYPNLSYENPVSFTQFQVWLFNQQDSTLYDKFYKWFDSFKERYDYHSIIDKYSE